MFKITTEKESSKQLSFRDVEEDQFFVNRDGYLCQKSGEYTYSGIANSDGDPCSFHERDVDGTVEIQKIFPKVLKIEF